MKSLVLGFAGNASHLWVPFSIGNTLQKIFGDTDIQELLLEEYEFYLSDQHLLRTSHSQVLYQALQNAGWRTLVALPDCPASLLLCQNQECRCTYMYTHIYMYV